jgi:hypothetical protein
MTITIKRCSMSHIWTHYKPVVAIQESPPHSKLIFVGNAARKAATQRIKSRSATGQAALLARLPQPQHDSATTLVEAKQSLRQGESERSI